MTTYVTGSHRCPVCDSASVAVIQSLTDVREFAIDDSGFVEILDVIPHQKSTVSDHFECLHCGATPDLEDIVEYRHRLKRW